MAKPIQGHQTGLESIFRAHLCHGLGNAKNAYKPRFCPLTLKRPQACPPGIGKQWQSPAMGEAMPQAMEKKKPGQCRAGVSASWAGLRYSPGQIGREQWADFRGFPAHKRGKTNFSNAGRVIHRAAVLPGRICTRPHDMHAQYLAFLAPLMHGNGNFDALEALHTASMAFPGAIAA